MNHKNGLKFLAALELIKGGLVLLACLVLLELLQLNTSSVALNILSHAHPGILRDLVSRFLSYISQVELSQLKVLFGFSFIYVLVRLAEAFGLWFHQNWGRVLSVYSTALYLPFELYELINGFSLLKCSVTLVNISLLLYLVSLKNKPFWRP